MRREWFRYARNATQASRVVPHLPPWHRPAESVINAGASLNTRSR
jgi:hypothetical protein